MFGIVVILVDRLRAGYMVSPLEGWRRALEEPTTRRMGAVLVVGDLYKSFWGL